MMKRSIEIVGLCIVIGSVACFTSGCTEQPKKENDILEDYIENATDLTFVSWEALDITKRQTNQNEKKDTIYGVLSGKSEYANYEADVVLYYNYYDQGGWILDGCYIDDYQTTDIQPPAEENIESCLRESWWEYFGSNYTDFEISNIIRQDDGEDDAFADYTLQMNVWYDSALSYRCLVDCELNMYYDKNIDEWSMGNLNYDYESQEILGFDGWWGSSSGTKEVEFTGDGVGYTYVVTSSGYYSDESTGDVTFGPFDFEFDVLKGIFYIYDDNTRLNHQGEQDFNDRIEGDFCWDEGCLRDYFSGRGGEHVADLWHL